MTTNERALLLAVAKRMTCQLNEFKGDTYVGLIQAIAAVEAEDKPWINARVGREAAPDPMQSTLDTFGKILHAAAHDPEPLTEAKSCETCDWFDKERKVSCAIFVGDCDGESKWKAIKPTEADVCPTCGGNGDISVGNGMYPDCYDCDGTGKKETK